MHFSSEMSWDEMSGMKCHGMKCHVVTGEKVYLCIFQGGRIISRGKNYIDILFPGGKNYIDIVFPGGRSIEGEEIYRDTGHQLTGIGPQGTGFTEMEFFRK